MRSDSIAIVDSKGLLGDKIINITVGSPDRPQLQEGATLRTEEVRSVQALTRRIDSGGSDRRSFAARDSGFGGASHGRRQTQLSRALASLADILERVDHGDGLAHRLVPIPLWSGI